tara:strand:+ start:23287 stop:23625 length:339 start_codon:yes stop_codon:yes gene_type:complete
MKIDKKTLGFGIFFFLLAGTITAWNLNKYYNRNKNSDKPPVVPDKSVKGDSFPLERGSTGENVKALQKSLISMGANFNATGYLGSQTEAFLKNLGYDLPLEDFDYANLVHSK